MFQGLWWVSSVSVELGKDREILIGKRNKKISSPRKGPTGKVELLKESFMTFDLKWTQPQKGIPRALK